MTTTHELDTPPNLALLYAKAAATSLTRGAGLPDTELVLPEVGVDAGHLADYSRVCGFTLTNRLPPTYLHVLAFPLAVQLMATPSFPFPLPGVVHVANRITQHRPIDVTERLRLSVHLADLRPHEKGQQFDFVAEAAVDGEPVWSSVSTNLRRGGGSGDGNGRSERSDRPDGTAVWSVPKDTGRRYGAVAGDRNPIHLYPLTARLFGFPRPIAHGMWTKARCLAALQPRLPERFTVDVAFKLPLLLPAKVSFGARERDGHWDFALTDAPSGKPHLDGTLTPAG